MAWIDPVTTWKSTDFINYTDYNRIKGNVAYILSIAPDLVYDTYPTMGADKSRSQYPYATEWNAIEKALNQLATNIGGKFAAKSFMANGVTLDYVELNRIESMTATLKEQYENAIKAKYRLSFHLGRKRSEQGNSVVR